MPLQTHAMAHGEFLFGNVQVQSVVVDGAAHTLTLHAVYAERELCSISYRGVFYSQLGQSLCGKQIAAALDLAPEALASPRYQRILAHLGEACCLHSLPCLEAMRRQGYRFFVHFIGSDEKGVVVAQGVSVH